MWIKIKDRLHNMNNINSVIVFRNEIRVRYVGEDFHDSIIVLGTNEEAEEMFRSLGEYLRISKPSRR